MDVPPIEVLKSFILWVLTEISRGSLPALKIPSDSCTQEAPKYIYRKFTDVDGAKPYTEMMMVIGLIAELMHSKRTLSQRDIYYCLKNIIKVQATCNTRIIEVGKLLGLKRYQLGIIPASRGFLNGLIQFRFHQPGTDIAEPAWVNGFASSVGIPISSLWSSISDAQLDIILPPDVRYLLVIEKEGVFHRLSEDHFPMKLRCVMVTGCGFPDIATRAFVKRTSDRYPHICVLGLSDYNPYGLALMNTFKFGSKAKQFEGNGLQVPSLRWLGLRYSQVKGLQLPKACLQKLSQADHHKIQSLLKEYESRQAPEQSSFKNELHVMLQWGYKCELEALYSKGIDFTSHFLENVILSQDFL